MSEAQILFNISYSRFVVQNCSFKEIIILSMLSKGYSQCEIADKFECTSRNIRAIVSNLKKKIQNFLIS